MTAAETEQTKQTEQAEQTEQTKAKPARPDQPAPKAYASDQEVRWCPGCGDYAILKAVQKTLSELGARPETTAFVSGIGCAARFPYYMATYGFHTIHGRAPAVATGIKLANPALDVWVISGDGDALSIGGNHLLHLLRRNVDLQFLLFNNEIYGLTKGQSSPTSQPGTRSPSSPTGSIEAPVDACSYALGSGARFVARSVDTQQAHLGEVLTAARRHRGTGFVEILQNCIVYNDKVFAHLTDKSVQADAQLQLQHGRPLLFGQNRDRGLRLNPRTIALEVVPVGGDDGVAEDEVLVHDATNLRLAQMLAGMQPPAYPVAMGVLYDNPADSYERQVKAQETAAREAAGLQEGERADLNALLRRGHTWTVG